MADETTRGPGGDSKIPTPDTSGIPEPVILEEHIVGPARVKAPPSTPLQGPPPAPRAPSAPAVQPSTPPQSPVVPLAPVTPSPAAKPAPVPPAPAPKPELKNDIANILKEAKLPERHDAPSSERMPAQKETKTFDTTLGAKIDVLDKPTPISTPLQPTLGRRPTGEASVPSLNAPEQQIAPSEPASVQSDKAALEKTSVVSVHTLKDDLQHVVRDQKISVVRAVSLEQDRKHRQSPQTAGRDEAREAAPTPAQTQRSKRVLGILFSVFFLLVLGGGALGGVYLIARQRAGSTLQQATQSILFAESTVALPIGTQQATDLKRVLGNARQGASGTLGSITRIVPTVDTPAEDGTTTTRPATFSEFTKAIQAGAPDDLLRATGDDFFFGIHTVDKNAPLIVVSVTSYDRAFAAMLAWEPTMNAGLSPMFSPLPAQIIDQNGLPVTRTFQDIVMRNYDVRALKDDAGNVSLYYSFPTQNILIIAESPYSFAEILSRLQAGRKL